MARVASPILANLQHAHRPSPQPIVAALIAAAEAGDGLAMGNLGVCCERGEGVERDLQQAIGWHRLGAEFGDETASAGLRRLQSAQALLSSQREPDGSTGNRSSRLAEGLSGTGWLDAPPIPGDWEDLTGTDAQPVLARLWPRFQAVGVGEELASIEIQRLRQLPLSFYPGCVLVDIQLRQPGQATAVLASALVSAGGAALLNGTLNLLHAINPDLLALNGDDTTLAYLRFSCAFSRAEKGPFPIIDDVRSIPLDDVACAGPPQEARQAITPPRALDGNLSTDGWRRFDACVLYGNTLVQFTFRVFSNGVIEAEAGQPIATDLPIRTRRYDGIFRTPWSAPADA